MTKQIQDAYIVAATRTPVGKAPKGVFRNTRPDDMLAHVLKSVVAQAPGIDLNRIDDAIIGCAMPEAEQGMNVARIGVLLAGLPDTIAAQTVNRFCSSGLQAVAMAADQIRLGNADLMLAGGTESMSMVPMMGNKIAMAPSVFDNDHVAIAYGMGITAEKVAEEWKVSREEQDAFALASHRRRSPPSRTVNSRMRSAPTTYAPASRTWPMAAASSPVTASSTPTKARAWIRRPKGWPSCARCSATASSAAPSPPATRRR